MTQPTPLTQPRPATPDQAHAHSLMLAAEAVLATQSGRAPYRVTQVSLQGGVTYALDLDPWALKGNRSLLEDAILIGFAAPVVAELSGQPQPGAGGPRAPRTLAMESLIEAEELEVMDAYLTVLRARCQVALRRAWAEVQVVAAGLREHGTLDHEAVAYRLRCAQGIRSTLLN